jgi:uncharacterized protein HemX
MSALFLFFQTSSIGKWLSGKMIMIILIAVGTAAVGAGVWYVKGKINEFEQNKITISKQKDQIDDLTTKNKLLTQSDQGTVKAVETLNVVKEEVKQKTQEIKTKVDKKIQAIQDSPTLTVEDKTVQTSAAYVDGLQEAYCQAVTTCTPPGAS